MKIILIALISIAFLSSCRERKSGKPLDSTPQKIELIYGTPDQLIKGLNIVIGSLKKGEFSKIIVPSRLAFGELGSSNQLVQPYTPLVYNLTLIDIK